MHANFNRNLVTNNYSSGARGTVKIVFHGRTWGGGGGGGGLINMIKRCMALLIKCTV